MPFIGMIVFLTICLLSLVVPECTQYAYDQIDLNRLNEAPSLSHWFGTDDLGRDLFSRVFQGARLSLMIGFIAAFFDLIFGVIYGTLSALIKGKIDEMMMRLLDVLSSIPYIMMVILFLNLFSSGLTAIIAALMATGWINMARLVRSKLLEVREAEFIKAAYLIGASKRRIIFTHLIPSCTGIIITQISYTIPTAIFFESFLSFLGLGIQAPEASWGVLLSEGVDALQYFPWRLIFPALIMILAIYALNTIGDYLRICFESKGVYENHS